MQQLQLASFSALANGQRASAQIPSYSASLARVSLYFPAPSSLTKATMTEIVMKIGSRTFFGPISASQLDSLMKYRGQFDLSTALTLDLTERNALTLADKERGAIDLPGLGGDAVFIEVLNNAGAGTPTLSGVVGYTGRQFTDVNKDKTIARGEQPRANQLIHKLLRYSLPQSGTRIVWQPNFKGALIKRVHFVYAGTDWTASADGNLYAVECRRDGRPMHERVGCRLNRFYQQEQGLVPQSRTYTVDFVADGNIAGGALYTLGAKSLEFILDMTAADVVTAYVECLDLPENL